MQRGQCQAFSVTFYILLTVPVTEDKFRYILTQTQGFFAKFLAGGCSLKAYSVNNFQPPAKWYNFALPFTPSAGFKLLYCSKKLIFSRYSSKLLVHISPIAPVLLKVNLRIRNYFSQKLEVRERYEGLIRLEDSAKLR